MEKADSYVRLAKKLIESNGDLEKARKLLNLAIGLNPNSEAKVILRKLDDSSKKETKKTDSVKEEPVFTKEQKDDVERVNKSKNYYEVLEVPKNASDADLKKAYRKLALQLHPDKNHAPGASDAFKSISHAYSVLSNPDKRRTYDLSGSEESYTPDTSYRREEYFQDEMSPEELFNAFFGNMFMNGNGFNPHRNVFFINNNGRTRFRQRASSPPQPPRNIFVQLIPVILFIGFSILTNLFQSSPPYDFNQSEVYKIQRTTYLRSAPYFVKDDFTQKYSRFEIRELELQIENEYVTYLSNICYREEQNQQNLIFQGRLSGRQDILDKAKGLDMSYCKKLHAFRNIPVRTN